MSDSNTNLVPLFMVNGLAPAYSSLQANFSLDSIPDTIAYIIDAEGWKLFKRNGICISLIKISTIDGSEKIDNFINFTATKLPLELIKKVTAFFKQVYDKHKSEAVGYLYYESSSGEWDFIPPAQKAGPANVKYDKAPIKNGWSVVGTIHSHANLTAFHSGTDHDDEKYFDGVHITIGKLDTRTPEFACSIVCQGARAEYEPNDLIDGMDPVIDAPAEWMCMMKLDEPDSIDDEEVGLKIELLYDAYYDGKISEEKYLKNLAKLENKIKKIEAVGNTSANQAAIDTIMDGNKRLVPYVRRHNRWGSTAPNWSNKWMNGNGD